MKYIHLFPSTTKSLLRNTLFGAAGLTLSACSKFSGGNITLLPEKTPARLVEPNNEITKASKPDHKRKEKKSQPVTTNTVLWPASWKTYHIRFNNYLEARNKYWPHPEIKFREPFHLQWDLIVSKDWGSYASQQKDGIRFFRNGRHYLTRGFDNSKNLLKSFNPGVYAASVRRPAGEYQHMSPPFYFSVIAEEDSATGAKNKRIDPYHPKSEDELFPNQWWYYQVDFFWWDTHGNLPKKNGKRPKPSRVIPALKFFTNLRPFEPSTTLEEAEGKNGPIVKRNLLSPQLENLLELRLYYEGKLMKKEPATNIESWTFNHGPGHYVFLIVAPDDNGSALIVARPFQTWFPDEGDGILRLTPLDSDKDGIPDYWERWHDLNPNDANDASTLYGEKRGTTFLDYYKNQKSYNKVR